EIATTITPEMMDRIEKASKKVKAVDKWIEGLSQKGRQVIEKETDRYTELTKILNEINEVIELCENEVFSWEGFFPKLEAITQLEEDLLEKEGIVPPEEKGTQYVMEDLARIRVETINQVKEKLEIEKEWVEKTIDNIDIILEQMVFDKHNMVYGNWEIDTLNQSLDKNIKEEPCSHE
ncbi:hypothetical protein KI387_040709, partial [Taxus chinensis]